MSVDNISKLTEYVSLVAKAPFDVDGKTVFKPKDHIKLQQTFFHQDGCNFCGGCCVAESNVYPPSEYEHIMNCTEEEFLAENLDYKDLDLLKAKLKEEVHNINGKDVVFHTYKLDKNEMYLPIRGRVIPRCSWVREFEPGVFKCIIHPVVSLTCDMPHLRFTYSKHGTVSVGTQQFGRNWALGCEIKFTEPETEEQFNQIRQSRIRKLMRIHTVAQDFEVDTWIPELVDYINRIPFNNYHDFLSRDAVVLRKTFFGRPIP